MLLSVLPVPSVVVAGSVLNRRTGWGPSCLRPSWALRLLRAAAPASGRRRVGAVAVPSVGVAGSVLKRRTGWLAWGSGPLPGISPRRSRLWSTRYLTGILARRAAGEPRYVPSRPDGKFSPSGLPPLWLRVGSFQSVRLPLRLRKRSLQSVRRLRTRPQGVRGPGGAALGGSGRRPVSGRGGVGEHPLAHGPEAGGRCKVRGGRTGRRGPPRGSRGRRRGAGRSPARGGRLRREARRGRWARRRRPGRQGRRGGR